jgi:hypothetical protein
MRIERGDFTVGDVGVAIELTADITLTGIDIDFVFIKPSGATITRDSTSISGSVAQYVWATGDLDEAGQWYADLYENDTGYFFTDYVQFKVRPKPQDMARN